MLKIVIILLSIVLFSCIDKHFLTYSIEGQKIKYDELKNNSNRISDFKLYFNKDEIDTVYTEIHFIATDYYYYGQFFFDKNFMSMLKGKTLHMGADALIYEKGRTDFPDYNKSFLYFTAIKYNN